MKLRIAVIVALGLSLALYLVWSIGVSSIVSSAIAVGWSGFAILCVYAVSLFLPLGAACGVLLPDASLKGILVFVWARMVRDAATEVLPFSSVGGLLFGARAAMLHGMSQPCVFAATIVDVTTELLAQVGYIALGIVIVVSGVTEASFTKSLTKLLVIEFAFVLVAGIAIIASQRYRHRIAALISERFFRTPGASTVGVTGALDAIYRSRARIAVSLTLHFMAWIASAIGVLIAFRFMGSNVGLEAVIALESLVCAARSVAFLVPNAIGVQEGAYALFAPMLGVGAEIGVAVSFIKRARDIAVGVPILLIWQGAESHRALRGRTP